jgi:hypothetical protein
MRNILVGPGSVSYLGKRQRRSVVLAFYKRMRMLLVRVVV